MSCAFDDTLDPVLAAAFMEGYRQEEAAATGKGYLTISLQMLWYMESVWWIRDQMDRQSPPPRAICQGDELAGREYEAIAGYT